MYLLHSLSPITTQRWLENGNKSTKHPHPFLKQLVEMQLGVTGTGENTAPKGLTVPKANKGFKQSGQEEHCIQVWGLSMRWMWDC